MVLQRWFFLLYFPLNWEKSSWLNRGESWICRQEFLISWFNLIFCRKEKKYLNWTKSSLNQAFSFIFQVNISLNGKCNTFFFSVSFFGEENDDKERGNGWRGGPRRWVKNRKEEEERERIWKRIKYKKSDEEEVESKEEEEEEKKKRKCDENFQSLPPLILSPQMRYCSKINDPRWLSFGPWKIRLKFWGS